LKFNIKDIGSSGRSIAEELGDAEVRALFEKVQVALFEGPARARLEVELSRQEAQVLVRGRLEGSFFVECSRCLGPAEVRVEEPSLGVLFSPPGYRSDDDDDDEAAVSTDLPGADDNYAHDGERVDLEPVVREHLLLAIPLAPLCSESCRGLCPSCGADLNRDPCRCPGPEPAIEKPWAATLGRLKSKIPGA
jgi:uncharacterized protein